MSKAETGWLEDGLDGFHGAGFESFWSLASDLRFGSMLTRGRSLRGQKLLLYFLGVLRISLHTGLAFPTMVPDIVSGVASVIACYQLTAEVEDLCLAYVCGVRHADTDADLLFSKL